MERINRDLMFMEIARIVAKRSTCARLNVGAVVVVRNRIVSIGYNGPPAGEAHCSPECAMAAVGGCSRAVHAEINAMKFVPASERDAVKTIYITDSPCKTCYDKLLDPTFHLVALFYGNLYRVNEHLTLPNIFRITPSGYVIRHCDNEMVEWHALARS